MNKKLEQVCSKRCIGVGNDVILEKMNKEIGEQN